MAEKSKYDMNQTVGEIRKKLVEIFGPNPPFDPTMPDGTPAPDHMTAKQMSALWAIDSRRKRRKKK